MHELFLHYSLIKNVLRVQSNFGTLGLILFGGLLRSAVCDPHFGAARVPWIFRGATSGEGKLAGSRTPPLQQLRCSQSHDGASSHGCL